ncbi:DNA helicase, partial [Paramuricea clavata]
VWKEINAHQTVSRKVCAIVVDEAHCILDWGKDFRIDYGNLAVLCATFPNVPVIAMTATATKSDRESMKKILGIKECSEVVGIPDRKNICMRNALELDQM